MKFSLHVLCFVFFVLFLAALPVPLDAYCSCDDRSVCFGGEEDAVVFAFNFQAETSDQRSIGDATGLGLVMEMIDDVNDEGLAGTRTDELSWIDGGGLSIEPQGAYVAGQSYQARLRTLNVVPLIDRLELMSSDMVFTLEAWVDRERGSENVNPGPWRLFDMTPADVPTVAYNSLNSFSWNLGLDNENTMEIRVPSQAGPWIRLSAEVLPTVVGVANDEAYEHIVFVVNVTRSYTVNSEEDTTTLNGLEELYAYHNGVKSTSTLVGSRAANGPGVPPLLDWDEEVYRFAIGGAAWDSGDPVADLDSRQWPGNIHWLAMYDRILTEQEVQDHYNLGRSICLGSQEPFEDGREDDEDGSDGRSVLERILVPILVTLFGIGFVGLSVLAVKARTDNNAWETPISRQNVGNGPGTTAAAKVGDKGDKAANSGRRNSSTSASGAATARKESVSKERKASKSSKRSKGSKKSKRSKKSKKGSGRKRSISQERKLTATERPLTTKTNATAVSDVLTRIPGDYFSG